MKGAILAEAPPAQQRRPAATAGHPEIPDAMRASGSLGSIGRRRGSTRDYSRRKTGAMRPFLAT